MLTKLPYLILFLLLIACPGWAQSNAPYTGGSGDGYAMAELLVHTSPTAIRDNLASDINIYPSPLKKGEELIVELAASGKVNCIRFFDLQGNLLLEEKSTHYFQEQSKFKISSQNCPPGIYLLQLANQNTQLTKKIIIL